MLMKDYRLYVLMRNDLQSLSAGRCMAQANHAASAFEHEFYNNETKGKLHRGDVGEWKRQTKQGFGTCIVLSASKEQIDAIFTKGGLKRWITKGWVIDPDYCIRVTHEVARFMKGVKFLPETADENTIAFTRSEKTCAFIFGTKDEMDPYLGELPLY